MRDKKKTLKKAYDKLSHYDDMLKYIKDLNIEEITKENVLIYYTNSIIMSLKDLKGNDEKEYIKEKKKRDMRKNIKVRNLKQLIKRIIFPRT